VIAAHLNSGASGICYLFKQTEMRQSIGSSTDPANFLLYGLPELQKRGYEVSTTGLERTGYSQRGLAWVWRKLSRQLDGLSGDYGQTYGQRTFLRCHRMLVATGNNVGLPLLFLKRVGYKLPPVVFVSVGLNSLFPRLKNRQIRLLSKNLCRAHRIVVFSAVERANLIRNFRLPESLVVSLPFGIAPDYLPPFTPYPRRQIHADILSVGADPQRELAYLIDWARQNPARSVEFIVGQEIAATLPKLTDNVRLEVNLPLGEVFQRMKQAGHAVIPVRQNDYTGGTTFLIHAVGSGLPTLVAKTDAIKDIYHLEEGKGCLTYEPGNRNHFFSQMKRLLTMPPEEKNRMGKEGRNWVENHLNGSAMVDLIEKEYQQLCGKIV